LAEHCEWILNEPSVKREKMLNFKEWEKFCEHVKKGRRLAKKELGWGLAFGAKVDVNGAEYKDGGKADDEDGGETDDEMECDRATVGKLKDIEQVVPKSRGHDPHQEKLK
jgi:hypothetical protein